MTNQNLYTKIRDNILLPVKTLDHLHQSYYLPDSISFIAFHDLSKLEALEVLSWRNHPRIRSCMYNQTIISEEEHFEFLASLKKQHKKFYWVIREGDRALGVIDIVDYQGQESEWGFYLNPNYFGTGLSINLLFHALNFFFKSLKFSALYGFCHYQNTKALLFHDLFQIHHQDYQKIDSASNHDWYSHRRITATNWLKQRASIEKIKLRTIKKQELNTLETRKIKLDQIFLEVFNQTPSEFYKTKMVSKNLQREPNLFNQLIHRIENDFQIKISPLDKSATQHYMDALKLCF